MPTKVAKKRIIYRQRKGEGCCPRCGKKQKKSSKFIYCDACRAFFRNYNRKISESINEIRKEKYERRKDAGQCPRCGKSLGKKYGNTICKKCLEKQYQYNYGKAKQKK
ncbi:MAG: hypothetical protein LBH44_00975 [Treponema sp.]|jgi:Zn finger protein HypA/HybF involved in hydrogenase expression|nr:hypothetical protein [Treponema sp.]